jgi:hypothetical protein
VNVPAVHGATTANTQGEVHVGIAAAICFVFGLWCLAFVQAAGDGSWYFYARATLDGARLYSDLHLVLQPVFVLVNALGISLFGDSFIGQKLIFVAVLAGYIYFAAALVARAPASSLMKALLLLTFFFTSVRFEAYRFDDYHAFKDLLVLALVKFSLDYLESDSRGTWVKSSVVGVCLGLVLLTRINDGAAMLVAVSLLYVARRHPAGGRHYLVAMASMLVTAAVVFVAIGETPASWARSSIFAAAAAKGGGSGLLAYPVELVGASLAAVFRTDLPELAGLLLRVLLAAALAYWFLQADSRGRRIVRGALSLTVYGLLQWRFRYVDTITPFIPVVLLVLLAFCAMRTLRWFRAWREGNEAPGAYDREIMLLVPLALFFSGSMSSGGDFKSLSFPFALTLLVWGVAFDGLRVDRMPGLVAAAVFAQFAVFGLDYKLNNPYSWHSYRVAALTDPRVVLTTPALGRLPIEPGLNDFIQPVCGIVQRPGSTLLSLPFPYANYYCGLPPWKGYVQTFFDTSTKATIDGLLAELDAGPPQYILYQRQMINLRDHEIIYNAGRALPQRTLDEYILRRVEAGDWMVVLTSVYGSTTTQTESLWLLIETSEPVARPQQ